MAKQEKYRGVSNPDAHRADMERRRSNAAVPHDSRPKRERARRDATRAEIKRSAG